MRETERQSEPSALMNLLREHRQVVVVTIHALLFAFSLLSALGLAYNFHMTEPWFTQAFLPLVPLAIIIKLLVFTRFKIWRGSWRYVGLSDLVSLVFASQISVVLFIILFYVIENVALWLTEERLFSLMPDSAFLLDWVGTIILVAGVRVAVRLYHEEFRAGEAFVQARILIVGAGDAGESLLREIKRMSAPYEVVGYLDDDSHKLHARIHGVEVLGRTSDIKEIAAEYQVDEVLLAIPSATQRQIRRIVELCSGTGLRFSTVPAVSDLIEGRVTVSQIREVAIEDLLGRVPVTLDTGIIENYVRDKCIVVTGAGGSIGSEMCRQLARFTPSHLILIEQAENNLFEIDRELRAKYPGLRVIPHVADICDSARIRSLFRQRRPYAVFHAAAHKHVPIMEANIGEAVKNNVIGTRCVADAAVEFDVAKMVLISTDKAVNPTSVMGCSKRVAEMYVQQLAEHVQGARTQFVTVRFGNVLGSSGSVIPIFREQIRQGGPLTVTHPDMVRYFMTIPEAAQLVLQAGAMGRGGEIFVLDMGDPVRIVDLAHDMITLSGLRPGEDIEIKYTGMRPGEKLYEELSIKGEDVSQTRHPKIGIWRTRQADWDALLGSIERLCSLCDRDNDQALIEEFKMIVPEYRSDGGQPLPEGVETAVTRLTAGTKPPGSEPATRPWGQAHTTGLDPA
ncbi:MAG: polysaccharide biosynthesis protein [Phycisphaerales bacterium]|nr:MAG: polysaccharide biosynthesis protein [Phycisphaerales bacterium]